MVTKYPAVISLTSLNGTNGFTFTVRRPPSWIDQLPIHSAGDVNGDDLGDVLIGWPVGVFKDYHSSGGSASVIFGSRGGFPSEIAPSSLNGKNGFTFVGPSNIVEFGSAVSAAGDVNGDGIDDFIIGSSDAFGWHGAAAVVFGTKAGVPAKVDAASLNGANGFVIGTDIFTGDSQTNFGIGRAVSSAGDINGDGYDDLIIGIPYASFDPSPRDHKGSAVVLFGRKSGFLSSFDIADLDGANGFRMIGASKSEAGRTVTALGDINGDGLDDTWIGGIGGIDGAESHVVFGRKGGFGTTVDLTNLNARDGFAIASSSVTTVGDMNGDGIADFAAEFLRRGDTAQTSARIYTEYAVVFGRKDGYAATLDLAGLDGTDGFLIKSGPFSSWTNMAVSKGDINGDGIDDIVIAGSPSPDFPSPDFFAPDGLQEGDWSYYGTNGPAVFVVFGKKGSFAPSVAVSDLDGTNGFQITGFSEDFDYGSRPSLSADGDINGDGADDIIVSRGTPLDGDPAATSSVPVHVIYGGTSFVGATRNGTSKGETLTGTWNGDVLNGLQGADRLIGGAGDDRLDGGTGADRMEGGAGNDTFLVDQAGDTVIEAPTPRNGLRDRDTVITSVDYALTAGQGIEVLRADPSSRANLALTGNEFLNLIVGTAGNNVIQGGDGEYDELFGGKGDDVYAVKRFDAVTETDGQGNDTVIATNTYRLLAFSEVETLQLATRTGGLAFDLTGNEYAQVIRGNAGRNLLDGDDTGLTSRGADSLYGKGGDDTYVIRRGDDKVYEVAGQGNDTAISYVSYALAAGQSVETLQLHSSTFKKPLDLTGNELANTIYGNKGDNALDGGLGADVLTGRVGADSFVFSTKLGSGNVDRITDFAAEDTIRLAKGVFAALRAGPLSESAFKVLGPAKADADDRILYKQATGELFYDVDGSGKAASVLFAVLDNHAALTFADILVA